MRIISASDSVSARLFPAVQFSKISSAHRLRRAPPDCCGDRYSSLSSSSGQALFPRSVIFFLRSPPARFSRLIHLHDDDPLDEPGILR
ncbi:MAG: hypothetical protein D3906_00080 [Candidatus Electrothrix sp. AUS1_2]|nr:hypothetical protein [Candidatus Electrothrix sp. AUS1_2]